MSYLARKALSLLLVLSLALLGCALLPSVSGREGSTRHFDFFVPQTAWAAGVAADLQTPKYPTTPKNGQIYFLRPATSSSKVVAVPGASKKDSRQLALHSNSMATAERFQIYKTGSYYYLKNVHSHKALRVAKSKTKSGTAIVQQSYHRSYHSQQWKVKAVPAYPGAVKLVTRLKSSMTMQVKGGASASGAKLVLGRDSSAKAGAFYLIPYIACLTAKSNLDSTQAKTLTSTTYQIRFAQNPALALALTNYNVIGGVAQAALANNSAVSLAPAQNDLSQYFKFSSAGGGYYYLRSVSSGKPLKSLDNRLTSGASLIQYSASHARSRRFAVHLNTDGSYSLYSYISGMALRAKSAASGAALTLCTPSTSAFERFSLQAVDTTTRLAQGTYKISSSGATSQVVSGHKWFVKLSASGTQVTLYDLHSGASTAPFNCRYVGSGYYEISSTKGAKVGKWKFSHTNFTTASAMSASDYKKLWKVAKSKLGKKYVFGAEGPNSFDCSGFVYYCLRQSGLKQVTRLTAQGFYDSCAPIKKSKLAKGDLVFFTGTYATLGGRPVSHVGIYVGGGKMVNAGSPVKLQSINSSYYKKHYYASGRLL
ncbi:MAG: RICIN domain-containing protein [Coriobacteriales bacterium]|jgi:cell wall-associated NlpC family hydrolase|nr:RICIN domain-containing protein [Coriobacteriales bacterium]